VGFGLGLVNYGLGLGGSGLDSITGILILIIHSSYIDVNKGITCLDIIVNIFLGLRNSEKPFGIGISVTVPY